MPVIGFVILLAYIAVVTLMAFYLLVFAARRVTREVYMTWRQLEAEHGRIAIHPGDEPPTGVRDK